MNETMKRMLDRLHTLESTIIRLDGLGIESVITCSASEHDGYPTISGLRHEDFQRLFKGQSVQRHEDGGWAHWNGIWNGVELSCCENLKRNPCEVTL